MKDLAALARAAVAQGHAEARQNREEALARETYAKVVDDHLRDLSHQLTAETEGANLAVSLRRGTEPEERGSLLITISTLEEMESVGFHEIGRAIRICARGVQIARNVLGLNARERERYISDSEEIREALVVLASEVGLVGLIAKAVSRVTT